MRHPAFRSRRRSPRQGGPVSVLPVVLGGTLAILILAAFAVPAASWLVRPPTGRLVAEGAELSRQGRWPEALSTLGKSGAREVWGHT